MENSLPSYLERAGVLKTARILEAFSVIDRADFVPDDLRVSAYVDEPLPIGSGQTISQPHVVAFMLECLDPQPGEHIMDIGAGSGWQTALLAHIVSLKDKKGKVYAIERVPELCEFGRGNVLKYNFIKKGVVEWFCQDASNGLPDQAPFDKIVVAASIIDDSLPHAWQEQLGVGGKIVVPIKNSIWLFTKQEEGRFEKEEFPGFVFVPFIKENGNK